MDLKGRRVVLRLLLWLKWKLTIRGYQRNPTSAAGALVGLLIMLPLVSLAAVAAHYGFTSLPAPYPEHLLRGVLLGAYLFWIVSPMLGFALNESFDVTRLFVYPVTVRQLLIGAIAGSALDFPVLFLLPTLAAALIGFSGSAGSALVSAVVLLLFLVHTLSLGQSMILATAGMLRSRRYRDLLYVLIPLTWIVYYAITQMMGRGSIQVDWRQVIESPLWSAAGYLPPGMAAHGVAAAARGDLLAALGWSALLAGLTVVTVAAATSVIQRVYAGEFDTLRQPTKEVDAATLAVDHNAVRRRNAQTRGMPFGLKLPPVAEAIYRKEILYLARDPSFKAAIMNSLYALVVAVFMVIPGRERALPAHATVWPATLIVLLSEMRFFFNLFGTEGAAASLFFLFPASRREILIGKFAGYLVVGGVVNLALALLLCLIAGAPEEIPYLAAWMLLATGFFVVVGGILSVLFPMPVAMRGRRVKQVSAGQGCATGLLYLAVSLGAFIALVPVAAAIVVPRNFVTQGWLLLTFPLAAAYVAAAAIVSLNLSERMLLQRELEVIRKLGAEE